MNLFRRLLMHALALAVPLCTLAQDTESESNNSTGTANPLTLGVSMTGSMGACSPTDNSADFFVTTIPSQGVLRVQSSMSTTGASPVNLNFRVLSSGGSLLGTFPLQAGASGVAVNDEFRFTCRGQGQHFIEVQFPGGAQCINYTFTYDIVAPVFANDAETNNTTGTAVPIAVNTWSPGQVNFTPGDNNDYFQLDLPSNGVLNIEWEGEHTGTADPSTATLQLYTNAGSLLQTWTVPVGANSIPATDLVGILCRGNTSFYFLRVQSSVCGTSYRFRYNVTAPLFANDAESNNSTGTATTIPVNTFTEGHIDFYYGDNNDYYRLDLPSNGVLRVDVDAEHAGAGVGELLTVQLLSNGGSLLQTWTAPVGANSAAASSLLSMTCRGDQNHYFLRFTSGVCGASYRFRYRVDAPIFSNDVEPNNSTGEATTLPIGTETQGQINFHYGNNTDYYRVDLPGNGILNVQWQAEHAGATAGQTATIQLRNSGGSLLQNWTVPVGSDGIPESANVSITCRGNSSHYFLNIESGICGTSYKLSYTLTPPIYGINPVAGTGLGDAPTIVLNAANVEGQLNFYQGPTDAYYRIVLSATTDLSIGFLAEHAGASNGNFTARLLSSGGSLLLDQTIVAGANSAPVASTANYGSRAAGTYFLRLFGAPCGTSLRLLCNDADGDGVCNASDLCPGTPNGEGVNNNGCACSQLTVDDNDVCTLDECLNGNVTNTFQDADNDLTCDANDGCPNDPNKIAPGQCGCGVPDTDTDGDGLADCVDPCPALANAVPGGSCNDNNACTINDVYDANCNCAGTIQDTDGDGVCDA
ncbi:MAG TPA: hypothetical protein PKY96_15255, partial [Flavobacteriales bacterium]|nr:hypothetical protein [Flavobacteriales bacterium]